MVKIYIMDIRQLNSEILFQKSLEEVSKDRREKVLRVRRREDKNRVLGAGIVLARGLEAYGIREYDTVLSYGEYGKPYISSNPQIHFNLSHSGDYAAAAFSGCEVGIDIEHEKTGGREIAERFFSGREIAAIQKCGNTEEEEELFLRYWTLKESFLKVTGYGMRLPMDAFEFELQDRVKVFWKDAAQKYFFKEFEICRQCDIMADKNASRKERYRIAVCALEDNFAQELIWITQ